MMSSKRAIIAGFILMCGHGHSQPSVPPGQNPPPRPGLNTLSVEDQISSRVYRFGVPPKLEARDFDSAPFFIATNVSLDSAFQHVNSKLGDGGKSDAESDSLGLYLESKYHWSITASLVNTHLDGITQSTNTFHSDAFGSTVNLAFDRLHFWIFDPTTNSLTFEADLGYLRGNSGIIEGSPRINGTSDTYDIGPSMIFIHNWSPCTDHQISLTLSPSYEFEEQRSIYTGLRSQNFHSGLLSELARLDVAITTNCYCGVYGTWEHYISQSPASNQPELCSDWAKFGAAITYKINKCPLLFSVGYYYEAFNTDYDSHNVFAHVEYHF